MRPIDADKLLEYEIVLNENMGLKMVASQFITAAPTLDVAPVVHGEWIPVEPYGNRAKKFACTACKREVSFDSYTRNCDYEFCPQCGAKMDGKEERE